MIRRFLIVTLGVSTFAAIPALAAEPTTAPATQPTTRAGRVMIPELVAAMGRLEPLVPAEVRTGKRPASEREKLVGQFITVLLVGDNPKNAAAMERNQQKTAQSEKALTDRFNKLRADHKNLPPDVQAQLATTERLAIESIRLMDFLQRPKFPTDRESQLDLAQRLDQIPAVLDRIEALQREVPYHTKRLELMLEINRLEKASAATDEAGKAAAQTLAAQRALLAATDATYQAQLAVQATSTRPTTRPTTQAK